MRGTEPLSHPRPAAAVPRRARNRFRRSGRSILNRKSDFTCTAAAAAARPSSASARSFRRLVCPFVLWSGGAEGGSTKRPFQNTEDGSTDDDRSADDAAGNALGFCATTAANTVVALPIIAGIFPLIGGGRGRAQRALPFKWTAERTDIDGVSVGANE